MKYYVVVEYQTHVQRDKRIKGKEVLIENNDRTLRDSESICEILIYLSFF